MKIKTLFVAPYATMKNLIENSASEQDELDVHIEIGNLHEGVEIARKAEKEGYEVIISRGGTAKLIQDEVGIPVIDVHVSGYDMLRVLTLANDFNGKKAIVGFSNITLGARAITDVLDISIEVFTIETEKETIPLVQRLKREGYELIMGDVVTVNAAAHNGITGILIQSGKEAIMDAFGRASTMHQVLQKKIQETELQRAVLTLAAPDWMVLSKEGAILYENWDTFSARPLSDQLLESLQAPEYTPGKTYHHILQQEEEQLHLSVHFISIGEEEFLLFLVKRTTSSSGKNQLEVQTVAHRPFLIHQSQAMMECVEQASSYKSSHPLLLLGERGTGKRLLAQYVHYLQFGSQGLFSSISASDVLTLQELSLDHAIATVYIHSIHRLNEIQAEAFIQKVMEISKSGVLVIASLTSNEERWSSLLYHDSLNRIRVPALRERREDIPELVSYFMARFHQRMGTTAIRIKEDALSQLVQYDWRGNVSQLKALIKDAVVKEKGYSLEKKAVLGLLRQNEASDEKDVSHLLQGTMNEIEEKIIHLVLKEEEYNQTRAAKRLGITRATLWRKLKK
ncbi:Sigma-54 interaction domain-containing protein [Fictibacillus solisalsi]|uniref:Sigma-54 interaction domain-containing protein n=1 Tax=Fictibacillus solisalsi TaxID=459525 RepID=A0A1G9YS83_9BACL|nr:sigma-54-dependent transcriptional regulator [Fictibacillus solisalsi]SDN11940.1 Sigma-54 interaction domain-containing protein [Fictibacillus solisalsi]